MGIFSRVKSYVSSKFSKKKKATVTQTSIGPVSQTPIRGVDVGTSTQAQVGGYTVTSGSSGGSSSSSSGGGSSSGSSGGGTISNLQNVSQEQAQQLSGITPISQGATGTIQPQQETLEINPATNKPYGTISAAPSISTKWKNATKDKTLVEAGLWFGGQKLSGWLSESKYSPVYRSSYDKPIGKLASTSVEVGPYFIPHVGMGLLFASGTEKLATPKGWGIMGDTSTNLKEQYGVPKYLSIPGQVLLAGGETYLGAKGLTGSLEKGLKLPRTTTKITGVSKSIKGDALITEASFTSKTKRLWGTQTREGVSGIKTNIIKGPSGNIQIGESVSYGSSWKPSKLNLPESMTRVGDVKFSNIISSSASNDAVWYKYIKDGGLRAGKEFEGSGSIILGKGGTGTATKLYTKPSKFQFGGTGGSYDLGGNEIEVFGKVALIEDGKFLKQGTGTYEGIIKKVTPPSSNSVKIYSPSGGSGTPLSKTFETQIQQLGGEATASSLAKPINIFKTPSLTSTFNQKQIVKTNQVPITTQVLDEVKVDVKNDSKFKNLGLQVDNLFETKTKIRGGRTAIFTEPVIATKPPPLKIKIPTKMKQPQKLKTGIGYAPTSIYTPFIAPTIVPIIPIPKFPRFNLKTPAKSKSVGGKSIFGKSTSFAGLALGVKGTKKTIIGGKEVLTGMEIRGLGKKGQIIFETNKKKKQIKRKKK